jgi:hypothetical protein
LAACAVLFPVVTWIRDFLGEQRYRAAAADADRLDPGWRAESLMSRLEPIPAAQNSALRVLEISDEIQEHSEPAYDWDIHDHVWQAEPVERLDTKEVARLCAELEPLQSVLLKARALADFPMGRYPEARPMVTTLEPIPRTNRLRTVPFSRTEDADLRVNYLLSVDAVARADAGDCAGALASTRALFNVGRSFGDEPSRLAQEVRDGVTGRAVRLLERVLAQGEVSEELLASFQTLIEDEEARPTLLTCLRGDRAALDDLLGKVVAGKLPRKAIPGIQNLPAVLRFFLDRNTLRRHRVHILESLNQLVEAAKLPDGERERRLDAMMAAFTEERRSRGFVAEISDHLQDELLLHAYGFAGRWQISCAWRRTAIAGIAAERFRRAHDRWPAQLEELVPHWLAQLPRDPFADAPIRIRRFPDGLFIYSVGYDHRDDGGKYDPKNAVGRDADAGFRLWDPDHRGRPAKPAK